MYIHFVFSRFKDNITKQISELINKIFNDKKIIFKENPEFIPVYQTHLHPKFKDKEVFHIDLESFKECDNGIEADSKDIRFIHPNSDLYFLKEDVGMICFINIALNKLKNSPHPKEYGELGLVFNERFLKKSGIKPVRYYREESLFDDPLIKKWNLKYAYKPNLTAKELRNKKELETQILAYRKPATLFKSFSESRRIALRKTTSGVEMKIENVYDRYPIGYNFQDENEWRIVSFDKEFLEFRETDLYMIIVPNSQCIEFLSKYFKTEWKNIPNILVIP